MIKYVKWRNRSFQTSHEPEKWVPEAKADLIDGSTVYSLPVHLSNEDSEKIKRGEMVFSTQAQARAAAYERLNKPSRSLGMTLDQLMGRWTSEQETLFESFRRIKEYR